MDLDLVVIFSESYIFAGLSQFFTEIYSIAARGVHATENNHKKKIKPHCVRNVIQKGSLEDMQFYPDR